jgi:hypothetical protein
VFDPDHYEPYLDGRPRDDGTRSFRSSRSVAQLEHGADVAVDDRGERVHGP